VNNSVQSIRVLVVDDELDVRDGSERILNRIGYHVAKAARGDEALELLDRYQPAIILLDLKMPGMDGMEVLKHIQDRDSDIIVIVITGYATVETAIEAMKQGAYDFIPKPFEPDQLRIVVNRAAEKIRLTREAELLEQDKRRTLLDLDAEKSRLRTIIESLPDGLLVTNAAGQVVLVNPACKFLLDLASDAKPGGRVENYIGDESLCRLIEAVSKGKYVDYGDIPDHEFALSNEKYLRARAQPVLGERMECLGAVVNFVDISALKVLDRLKSEFVAKVSHELRSPLATIHEQLAMVISEMVGTASQQDQHLLTRAKEKTQGLISLIGDLLDLSRIEEGIICHEPKPVKIDELLNSIIDFLKDRAGAKGQSLEFESAADELPEIQADPLAMESIFGNLITNAINYTQEGGSIRVAADLTGINIRVRVIDNGFGIAEKHLDRIFERFYRVKDDQTRYITGTGLGLPIVKGLVDSMGGIIEVESTPGEGSTFTVLIPTEAG
jgi:signal transduction histidine kinase/FixJ family two-component response regulator